MSAQDKASGKIQKVTITSDRGRLSESEIERMIQEAEENAENDRMLKETVEAKNQLESYLYGVKSALDDQLKDKVEADDKVRVDKAITEAQQWLELHPSALKAEYDAKRKEVEAVAAPVISKAYQQQSAAAATSPTSDTEPSSSSADAAADGDAGATVDEVD